MKLNKEKLQISMARACMNTVDLEKKTGLKRPTLNNAITGRSISPKTLGLISAGLSVDPSELLESEEK